MTRFLLLSHVASTWYLVGLCWLVQRVQYPLMSRVGSAGFAGYEQAHVERISLVVGPPMLLELGTAIALVSTGSAWARSPIFLASIGLLAAIWLSTFAVQVPLHGKLAAGFDPQAHSLLVTTNWIRTLAWSARGVLVLWLLSRALDPLT